jgi:hypothetical protein
MYGRNPRELDFNLSIGAVKLCACNRISIEKRKLAKHQPVAEMIDRSIVSTLTKWFAKRYTRAAWPDEFNRRLQKVDNKLEKLLKTTNGQEISSILFMLEPRMEELADNVPYKLSIWLTVPVKINMDAETTIRSHIFETKLRGIINECEGVDLKEIETRSEADVSMDDLRFFERFDCDYRSIAPKPGGCLPPDEVV